MIRPDWQEYAMGLAEAAKTRSEDPYLQVGAVALRHDKSVSGVGYNGVASGMTINWTNREDRRAKVIHAERNCLRYCRPGEIWLIATTVVPCEKCVVDIASYGIKNVVYRGSYEGTLEASFKLAEEFGIKMTKV